MPKRSLSSTDTENEIPSSSSRAVLKRQKTQHYPLSFSNLRNTLARWVMAPLRPAAPLPPSQSSHPIANVYPKLPQPYSAPSSSRLVGPGHAINNTKEAPLEEGLSPQNPISLVDDEGDESGSGGTSDGEDRHGGEAQGVRLERFVYTVETPSRFSRSKGVRPPQRPHLPSSDSRERGYSWAETGLSTLQLHSPKVLRKRTSANEARRTKVKTGIQQKERFKLFSKHTFASPSRRKEEEYKAGGKLSGPESLAIYQQMLSGAEKPTLDANIKSERKPYKPSQDQSQKAKQKIQEPQNGDISGMLERIALDKQKGDKLAAARLKVSLPSELQDDEEDLVDDSFSNAAFSQGSVRIGSLQRLKPGIWLDDEIINHYGKMMEARSKNDETGKFPKVFYCNSFFYDKMKAGYNKALGRWTKKVKVFELDVLVMAINQSQQHWVCAAINMLHKRVEYYDSMGDGGRHRNKVFEVVMAYLAAEHQEKLGKPFDATGWTLAFSSGNPHQDNGCDCGVFVCQTLENIARGKDLVADKWEFSQANMPFFRRMMVCEIAQDKMYKRW